MSAFRRWRGRHEDAGLEGLYDRRIGRASAQRVAVDRSRPTQVGRALAQLGIEHIAAYSPAARGRSERMFATLQDRLPKELALTGIETVEVADAGLTVLSDTETPQGILLVCPEPPGDPAILPQGALLVLDGIQDPGNLGTLLRASAAFGVATVVVLDGTVDPYLPKAVRAATGALFRIRVIRSAWEAVAERLRVRGPLLMADMTGRDVGAVQPAGEWALVVGSEAAGPRPAVRAAATEMVAVPMRGGGDSLNAGVAGAILLYVLTRQDARA